MRFLIAVLLASCFALCGCGTTSLGSIECSLGITTACTPTPTLPAAVPTP